MQLSKKIEARVRKDMLFVVASGSRRMQSRSNGSSETRDAMECLQMERETGIEPATSSLGSWRSTAELLPLVLPRYHRLLAPAKLPCRAGLDPFSAGRVSNPPYAIMRD